MFTTNPDNERVVAKLIAALGNVPVGATVSYDDLKVAAEGKDVQKNFRYLLDRAWRRAEIELGCLFACVRSLGVRRMPADEAPEEGLSCIRGVRKKARRGSA